MNRITLEPGKRGGRPCIRGLRVRVKDILDLLAAGASRQEILAEYPYLEPEDIATLEAEGVVGDVCTVFLRADGTYEDLSLNERATGPTPAELRAIPRRICSVAGDNKVVPLLAALRAGVITDLVIDEQTATTLVERVMDLKEGSASAGELAFHEGQNDAGQV